MDGSNTYRVFKLDDRHEYETWLALGQTTIEPNSYGSAYLTAEKLGEEYGVGEYMYYDAGSDWPRIEFLTVTCRIVYFEAEKVEPAPDPVALTEARA